MPKIEDLHLATQVLRGDEGSAEALFDRVFDAVYRNLVSRLNGDHHTAQDIVAESLLAGLRGLEGYRGDASLESWFVRIAINKLTDLKRKRSIPLAPAGGASLLDALRDEGGWGTPLDRLSEEETRVLVREALESLPEKHREVLEWRYFNESSLGQVASQLDVSPKAAERRLARARQALAVVLRQRGVAQ